MDGVRPLGGFGEMDGVRPLGGFGEMEYLVIFGIH